ncbi:MAG TPA: STAS domain-containing protein [Kiritimatiellia bacterium]|nr:STAS domain-containing protein [Kiritimatiellia bacterium]
MSEAILHFEIEDREGGVRVVHVSGPLDSATYDQFKKFMDPQVNRPQLRLVLDCAGLTYVNSRGITLLTHYQRVCKMGISFFGIAALRPRILKSLELLGLDKLVTWYPTLEEAMQTAAAS